MGNLRLSQSFLADQSMYAVCEGDLAPDHMPPVCGNLVDYAAFMMTSDQIAEARDWMAEHQQ